MLKQKIENIHPLVEKPARYAGGELNSVIKQKNKVDIRFAFCFADVYEIGMSHLGMKIRLPSAQRPQRHLVRESLCPVGGYGGQNAEKQYSAFRTGKYGERSAF